MRQGMSLYKAKWFVHDIEHAENNQGRRREIFVRIRSQICAWVLAVSHVSNFALEEYFLTCYSASLPITFTQSCLKTSS